MPGKHITQQQRTLYMKGRQSGLNQEACAARAGISLRSGQRMDAGQSPSAKERTWRTREDPLEPVWDNELLPLLEKEPTLTGMTLWEHLDDIYPGIYPASMLRTLQRRVKKWRVVEGPEKDVIFLQDRPPGNQGLTDFSHPNSAITIAGEPFEHLFYQFSLAYSGWRFVDIVQGGESFSALSQGLQNALQKLGGSPQEHRTDSLCAAFKTVQQEQQFTDSYQGLCQHYGIHGTTNNLGVSHENGAIETAHGSFKHRLDQALKIRGSADFATLEDYRALVVKIVNKLNRYCVTRLAEERKHLKDLPKYRFTDYKEMSVKVTTSSTVSVSHGIYSVPSRLIGETLKLHLYHDKIRLFTGQVMVYECARVYRTRNENWAHRIDYRHLIYALARKPQAFRYSKLREHLLPDDNYRNLWQYVDEKWMPQKACKWIVGVLHIAAKNDCETRLGDELWEMAIAGELPDLKHVQEKYLACQQVPNIPENQHDLNGYDRFIPSSKEPWAGGESCLTH